MASSKTSTAGGVSDQPHARQDPLADPWVPMARPIDVKHLGKLAEELAEASAAVARCLIQGIDACEPVTGKPNKQWLEEELADVLTGVELTTQHFGLDYAAMLQRVELKKERLRKWHQMLA